MSEKCDVIGRCILFLAIITAWFFYSPRYFIRDYSFNNWQNPTLTLQGVKCDLHHVSLKKSPSLSSFVQATSGDQNFRLNGLAVYLELTDACQVLEDVSRAKIQLHKVALVTLKNKTRCPFQKLAVNAQNAGYTVLIHFGPHSPDVFPWSTHEDKLLIPVLNVKYDECKHPGWYGGKAVPVDDLYSTLSASDPTNVEITVQIN